MIKFFKRLKYIYCNMDTIKSALKMYNDKNIYKAIIYYNEDIDNMSILSKSLPYDYDYIYNQINRIRDSINKLKNRKDYNLIFGGYSVIDIVDYYKKEQLSLIINIIKYCNPVYNIDILETNMNNIKIQIDTILHASEFIEILDNIYSNIIDFQIDINIIKSYAKGRVVYNINISSDNIYKSLYVFIELLNDRLYNYIDKLLIDIDINFINEIYKLFNSFNKIHKDIKFINNLEFGKKEEILKIINNNKDFINKSLLLTNNIKERMNNNDF